MVKSKLKRVLLIVNDNPIDPLGVMYLIGNCPAKYTVMFVKDEHDERLNISYDKFDIVGFSTITGSHKTHNEIAKRIKYENHKIVTIMGGPHPTFFPEESLKLSSIDYICIGEGVVAFDKFLKDEPSLNIINDISHYGGKLEPAVDLSMLKMDRAVVYSVDGRDKNPIRNFMGMFGCGFSCKYCYSHSYYDLYKHQGIKKVRYNDPSVFVDEMKECVDMYNTKFLYLQDDTFIMNKTWFDSVTNLIKNKIGLPYHCHIRCNLVTEEIIQQLKNTGCYSVTFAVENADYEYRKKYLNRNMTNEAILNTAKLLHKYDIKFRIENMVGLPHNSLKDNIETMKLNHKCKPTIGWASLFQPFPNTELGNLCKTENLWDGDIDSINSSFFDGSCLNIDHKKEVERLQKIFSLCVDNKILYWLTPILVRLPLDKLYVKLYTKFKMNKYKKLYAW